MMAVKNIFISLICLGLILSQSQLQFIQEHWIDEDKKQVTILIDERLANGSDGACEFAAQIFHAITSQGYELYVKSTNGFVPSLHNPMDVNWTRVLIEDQDSVENAWQY